MRADNPFLVESSGFANDSACFPRNLSEDDLLSVIELLNRFVPVFLSAPAVQGKTTTLNLMSEALSAHAKDQFIQKRITLFRDAIEEPKELLNSLRDALRSNLTADTFYDVLTSSRLIEDGKKRDQTLILFFDTADTGTPEALRWLMHQCSAIQHNGGLLRSLGVHIIIAGSYQVDYLTSKYPDVEAVPELCIRRMSLIETNQWLAGISNEAGGVFHEECSGAIFTETAGDRYFSNYLGRQAFLLARRSSTTSFTVSPADIRAIAELVRTGRRLDSRVLPELVQSLADSTNLYPDLRHLIEGGSEAWSRLGKSSKRELFRLGAVSLFGFDGPLGYDSPLCLPHESPRYGVRNPMVHDLVRDMITSQQTFWSFEPILGLGQTEATTLTQLKNFRDREGLRSEYAGMHIAIIDGIVVDADRDRLTLAQRVVNLYPGQHSVIIYIDKDEETGYRLSPGLSEGYTNEAMVPNFKAGRFIRLTQIPDWILGIVVVVSTSLGYALSRPNVWNVKATGSVLLSILGLLVSVALVSAARNNTSSYRRIALYSSAMLLSWEMVYLLMLQLRSGSHA